MKILHTATICLCLFSPLNLVAQVKVKTAPAERLALNLEYTAPARVLPDQDSRLAAEINGVVQAVRVDVGDRVERGQTLAVVDCRDYRIQRQQADAQVQMTQANLKLAEAQLRRADGLWKEQHISEDAYQSRQSQVAVLKAQSAAHEAAAAAAKRNVAKCELRAPFDGVIVEKLMHVGDWVQTGTPILRLVSTQNARIAALVNLKLCESLNTGDKLQFAWREKRLSCSVTHILPVIDGNSRSREVRLSFDGPAADPGADGQVVWREQQTRYPAYLLANRGDTLGVFTAQGNKAVFVAVPTAVEGRPFTLEVDPQTQLITDGHLGLEHEDAIVIP